MKDYQNVAETIFDTYKEKYVKVFKQLYPAKNSTGFPERNLSVNYSKAVEALYPFACSWFEFQFGTKNNLHFDAVVIIPEIKAVLIIESKRFSNPSKKIEEIHSDIVRINNVQTEYFKEFADRIPCFTEYAVYGVILADVWTETKTKMAIKESFVNGDFIERYLPTMAEKNTLSGLFHQIRSFEEPTNYEWINESYYLVSMAWRIV